MTAFPIEYDRQPHPAVLNAMEAINLEEAQREREREYRESEEGRALDRMWRAMLLSPTIEICEALLRGENVPIDMLNADAVRRFGLK